MLAAQNCLGDGLFGDGWHNSLAVTKTHLNIRPLTEVANGGTLLWAGGRSFVFVVIQSLTGGKQREVGEMLILSWCFFFHIFAFSSHWFLCCKSLNRKMIPAFALVERRWQTVKSVTAALGIWRWSLAKVTHASRVSHSFASAVTLRPWTVRPNLRLYISKTIAMVSMWLVVARSAVVYTTTGEVEGFLNTLQNVHPSIRICVNEHTSVRTGTYEWMYARACVCIYTYISSISLKVWLFFCYHCLFIFYLFHFILLIYLFFFFFGGGA